ncbi:MAG: Gfo/Idh/MocA family protein [Candidatus Sumerlaeaceae bacterium]
MNPTTPARVGVVGCGAISDVYFTNGRKFQALEMVSCCDLDANKATSQAGKHGVSRTCSVEDIFADPDIDIILNLTIPVAHGEIALRALQAGKSTYGEKPLAVRLDDGRRMIELAREKNLRVGCAPDTFLGASHQTARRAIDEGMIGQPIAANCFMLGHGVETWHPNPEFYYKPGGGPMFDMGPYYLTALINMLGPVRRVTGSAGINMPQRTISSQPLAGKVIDVEVPTHVVAVLDFHSGAIATLVTSFDIKATALPNIEIYGTEAGMSVPDPNCFGGDVKIRGWREKNWRKVRNKHKYGENSRGVGLADMASAMQTGRAHRASGEVALHVLEIMHAVHTASTEGKHIELITRPERPAAMNPKLAEGVLG